MLEGKHPFKDPSEEVGNSEFRHRVLHQEVKIIKTANPKYVYLLSGLLEKVESDSPRTLARG